MVVDDLAGGRHSRLIGPAGKLCLEPSTEISKAVVGVFDSDTSLEGCSRLTRPGQTETLLQFEEFDNCLWADTPRGF